MSLLSLGSTTDTPRPGISLEGDWNEKLQRQTDFVVTYPHTTRSAPIMVDFQGSTEQSALHKKGFTLFEVKPAENEDDEYLSFFLSQERYWNNEVRKLALEEGIHHFVPKVLYLLRPETALTSCLHFLAKELGGFTDFEHQRDFIFSNPGLMGVTKKFWSKILENYWSAGFSPKITNTERYHLFLALIESLLLTSTKEDTSKSVPCPHVSLDYLHHAGVYLPSIEYQDYKPTSDGFALITKYQERRNFPGVPTDLAYYSYCYTCDTSFHSVNDKSTHACAPSKTVECTGCGLAFADTSSYQLHALTYCKQGPLSRSKCPVCNTAGPRCLCQTHWQRTYAKAVSIMKGAYRAGAWLAEDKKASSILLDAAIYSNLTFVPKDSKPEGQPTPDKGPISLKESLWTLDASFIPNSVEEKGTKYPMEPDGSQKGILWTSILAGLESTLGATLTYDLHLPDPPPTPKEKVKEAKGLDSTTKAERSAALHEYRESVIGTSGIQLDKANEKDLDLLTEKIENLSDKLADEKQLKFLTLSLKKNATELEEELQNMVELRSVVAAKLHLQSATKSLNRSLRKRLEFEAKRSDEDGYLSDDADKDDDEDDDDDDEDKGHTHGKSKKESDSSKSKITCRNEAHLTETPPYREFLTLAAKTAHLSRSHHCPFRKNTPSCPFFYELEEELGKHLLLKHPTPDKDETCPLCDTTMNAEHINRHMESVHSQCSTCKQWYNDLEDLKDHWDNDGGSCKSPTTEASPPKTQPKVEPPRTLTLATLPDISAGHESFLTEALSIILDMNDKGDKESKAKAKDLINKYSFQQRHQASINRNHYTSLTQKTVFLEQPSFSHPIGTRERPFDKALDAAEVTDLSPYTSKRFENFILCDAIHAKVCGYIRQYFLTERSAVYLFLQFLSPENQDTLRANYRRHPYELSYFELVSCLQYSYFNVNLASLRDSIPSMRRSPNEHPLTFHSRVYKLASLASVNFTEQQKTIWIEEKLREVFYKSLDNSLRLEIDEIESRTGATMSSSELLETYICRANLKSNPLDLNDENLMGVAKVTEEHAVPKKNRKVNVVTSYGSLSVTSSTRRDRSRTGRSKKKDTDHKRTPKSEDPPPKKRVRAVSTKQPPTDTPTRTHAVTTPARPPPTNSQEGTKDTNTRQADKQAAIEKNLQKLGLTPQMLENMGPFCWSCGAGLKNWSNEPYHARRYCNLPMFTGTPHTCAPGVRLFHKESDCPRKRRRVSKVRLQD